MKVASSFQGNRVIHHPPIPTNPYDEEGLYPSPPTHHTHSTNRQGEEQSPRAPGHGLRGLCSPGCGRRREILRAATECEMSWLLRMRRSGTKRQQKETMYEERKCETSPRGLVVAFVACLLVHVCCVGWGKRTMGHLPPGPPCPSSCPPPTHPTPPQPHPTAHRLHAPHSPFP